MAEWIGSNLHNAVAAMNVRFYIQLNQLQNVLHGRENDVMNLVFIKAVHCNIGFNTLYGVLVLPLQSAS